MGVVGTFEAEFEVYDSGTYDYHFPENSLFLVSMKKWGARCETLPGISDIRHSSEKETTAQST